MTITHFNDLMAHAEREQYAIGYFESWNLESLMAIVDAAEATQSPVLLGFSGIYFDHPKRVRKEILSVYSTLGLEVCRQTSIPSALVFNESPHHDLVLEAIDQGFGLVMFSDDHLSVPNQTTHVQQIVEAAHRAGAAVEGELESLPGIGGNLIDMQDDARLTNVETAREFVEETGVDAFAVNAGQMHFHGKRTVRLKLDLIKELNAALDVPLVLHGSTSISRKDLEQAVNCGIRKFNVGSVLKQTYFEAMRRGSAAAGDTYNPYEIIGSGLGQDVLMTGRIAMQQKVEDYMDIFRSAGKAKSLS
jgi:ketose-bisphosphate aldolase